MYQDSFRLTVDCTVIIKSSGKHWMKPISVGELRSLAKSSLHKQMTLKSMHTMVKGPKHLSLLDKVLASGDCSQWTRKSPLFLWLLSRGCKTFDQKDSSTYSRQSHHVHRPAEQHHQHVWWLQHVFFNWRVLLPLQLILAVQTWSWRSKVLDILTGFTLLTTFFPAMHTSFVILVVRVCTWHLANGDVTPSHQNMHQMSAEVEQLRCRSVSYSQNFLQNSDHHIYSQADVGEFIINFRPFKYGYVALRKHSEFFKWFTLSMQDVIFFPQSSLWNFIAKKLISYALYGKILYVHRDCFWLRQCSAWFAVIYYLDVMNGGADSNGVAGLPQCNIFSRWSRGHRFWEEDFEGWRGLAVGRW